MTLRGVFRSLITAEPRPLASVEHMAIYPWLIVGLVSIGAFIGQLDATIVPEETARYVVGVVRKTRVLDGVMLGASSRAAIHLMSASKANARLEGRDTVLIEDVRTMAHYVLPHRLICEDEDLSPTEALQTALDSPILSEP